MEYKGWKLFDKVILIAKQKDKNGFEQAYVVEYGNASQLKTAMDWARDRVWNSETREYGKETPGVEFEFENEGFEVELYDSANGSSQGGKLSFWDCLIRKDDHIFRIGINSDYLLELLKTTTVINGVVQEKVFFARNNGRVGLLHEGMKEYKDALKDMQFKKNVSENKTKNHIRGHAYSSITLKNMYLGEIYNWLEIDKNSGYYHTYKLLNKPKKEYIFVREYYFDDNKCKTITEFMRNAIKVEDKYNYKHSNGYILFDTVKKIPERVDDGKILTDDFSETELQQCINIYNDFEHNQKNGSYYRIENAKSLFYTASPNIKPKITKSLLDKLNGSKGYYSNGDNIIYDLKWFESEDN